MKLTNTEYHHMLSQWIANNDVHSMQRDSIISSCVINTNKLIIERTDVVDKYLEQKIIGYRTDFTIIYLMFIMMALWIVYFTFKIHSKKEK